MLVDRHRRLTRVALLALAFVVLAAQVVWARATVCGTARELHAACACCEERARAPEPVIAADCCAVEESAGAMVAPGVVAVLPVPALAVATLPPMVVVDDPGGVVANGECAKVEARCAGPPLWLRLRTLRL
jgi:hypothetical protein